MAKYHVKIDTIYCEEYRYDKEIEAENEEHAKQLAFDDFSFDSSPWSTGSYWWTGEKVSIFPVD